MKFVFNPQFLKEDLISLHDRVTLLFSNGRLTVYMITDDNFPNISLSDLTNGSFPSFRFAEL